MKLYFTSSDFTIVLYGVVAVAVAAVAVAVVVVVVVIW